MDQLTGSMLGQYHLIAVIGRGHTATVYQAYQQSLGRHVAVKVLHLNLDPQFTTRFQREAQAVAQLHHRNILPIYDYGEERGVRYFVTQYIENSRTLDRLTGGRPMPVLDALKLVADLLGALDYAHQRGILHRDVKPSNILMPSPDWPLLADFGIAKLLDETSHLTPPGQMIGTAAYLAPERGLGKPADARTDLYATGVVLYELLTGQTPFEHGTPASVMMQHVYNPPPPARSLNPAIPPQVEELLQQALEKDPERRYPNAAAMLHAVRRTARQVERTMAQTELAGLLTREVGAPPARRYDTVDLAPLAPAEPRGTAPDSLPAAPPRSASRALVPLVIALLIGVGLVAGLLLGRGVSGAGETSLATAAPQAEATVAPTGAPPALSPLPQAGGEAPAPATEAPAPTLAPTAEPTAIPPEPTAAPAPTSTIAPAPTAAPPLVVADPAEEGSLVLEDDAWAGGFGGASGRRSYGGRTATWVYGQGTGYELMRASFVLDAQPEGTTLLTVEGMDSEGRAKTEILVTVNGTEVYRGPNPLPDDDIPLESGTWAAHSWEFDAGLLRPGRNEISITNLSPGEFSRPPFFALDYAVVTVAR